MNIQDIDKLSPKELMELLSMTEGYATKEDCKFFLYEPNPIPKVFHASTAKTRALFGGNRSGKTYSTMIDITAQFIGKVPRSLKDIFPQFRLDPSRRIRLCMNDYPNNFSKVIWPYIQQLVPADEIADVVKDSGRIKSITNRHGGFIEFMQYDQDVSKFQGTNRHVVAYDETPPAAVRDENLMRLADTDGEEIYSLTPIDEANYGGSSMWLFDEVVKKASKIYEMVDETINLKTNTEGREDIEIFFANIYHNKTLSKIAIDRILSGFGEQEREIRTTGHFLFLSGLVYKEFNELVHLIDPIPDWNNPEKYTIYMAIDPHPKLPHAILFMAVDKNNIMYFVDEIFSNTDTVDDLAELITMKLNGAVPELCVIDPMATTPDPIKGNCLMYELAEAFDRLQTPVRPIPASKNKSHGVIKMRAALSFKQRSLYVTRNCKRFRHEISHYVWDSYRKEAAMTKGEKQKPVDKDDHMMENAYRLVIIDPEFTSKNFGHEDSYEETPKTNINRNHITGY